MRLTLRTLLAYLDDILEPADAREIGAKIAESSVAGSMVARIREVMRRRRITAPELTGPGSGPDPNLVAEYLDNTLTPEGVTEIERLCLESDIHLAETAGCHQILTIVLGEPVEISSRSRERMYALGAIAPPQGQTEVSVVREPVPPATADTRRNAAAAAASVQPGDDAFAKVPDYLRKRPLWRRLVPVAALAVLVGWLALVVDSLGLWQSRPPATAPVVDHTPAPPAEDKVPVEEQPAATETVAAPAVVATEPSAAPEPAAASEPSPTAPQTDAAVAATTDATITPPSAVPEAPPTPTAEPPVEPSVANAAAAPEAQPADAASTLPAPAAPPIYYTSIDGIALQYQPDAIEWNVLARHTRVQAGQWLATPEPFFSRLDVRGGQLAVLVNAGTIVQPSAPQEGHTLSLLVDRGRVGLLRAGGDAATQEPCIVTVHVGDLQFEVELLEPGTLVGVEVLWRQPNGPPQPGAPASPGYDGGLYVVAGSAVVQPVGGERIPFSPASGWLPWPVNGVWQTGPLFAMPQWLTPDGPTLQSTQSTWAKLYEKQFPLDQPVSVSIPAVVRDRRGHLAEFAVETLELTQNIPQLLRALQADHDEARLAAIVALRQWLPRSEKNAETLRDELARYYRNDEVEPLNELLWGYRPDDLRIPDVSGRLVDWLSHDDVAVRELALYQIRTVANRSTDYHPLAPLIQRDAAIKRLQETVRRQGGLLPPLEQPPAPATVP